MTLCGRRRVRADDTYGDDHDTQTSSFLDVLLGNIRHFAGHPAIVSVRKTNDDLLDGRSATRNQDIVNSRHWNGMCNENIDMREREREREREKERGKESGE